MFQWNSPLLLEFSPQGLDFVGALSCFVLFTATIRFSLLHCCSSTPNWPISSVNHYGQCSDNHYQSMTIQPSNKMPIKADFESSESKKNSNGSVLLKYDFGQATCCKESWEFLEKTGYRSMKKMLLTCPEGFPWGCPWRLCRSGWWGGTCIASRR